MPPRSARLPIVPSLAVLLLAACGGTPPAERVAALYWDAMRERDYVTLEGVSTDDSHWALEEAVFPLMGTGARLDPERAAYGEDTVRIPTELERDRFPLLPPVVFDTVLVRDTDGYRVDVEATLEAYRSGARRAAEDRYRYAASELRERLGTAADEIVARIETIRARLGPDLEADAVALTRALQGHVDEVLEDVAAATRGMLRDMASTVDQLRAELEAMQPPEDEDAAASAEAATAPGHGASQDGEPREGTRPDGAPGAGTGTGNDGVGH